MTLPYRGEYDGEIVKSSTLHSFPPLFCISLYPSHSSCVSACLTFFQISLFSVLVLTPVLWLQTCTVKKS